MNTRSFISLVGLGAAILSSDAWAGPTIMSRCDQDSLSPGLAEARLKWMRRCALKSPKRTTGSNLLLLKDVNGAVLTEYFEYPGTSLDVNSYVGPDKEFGINMTYAFSLFPMAGPYSAQFDEQGFSIWSKASPKPQPVYPVYGTELHYLAGTALYPHPSDASDCNLYPRRPDGVIDTANPAPSFYLQAFCTSSCYTPEQRVSFAGGDFPIADAMSAVRTDLIAVSPSATLAHLSTARTAVGSYTAELGDGDHVIYNIRTASGEQLRVTPSHPVLRSDGSLVEAQMLRLGDRLLHPDGTPEPITIIEIESYHGKVYNLSPASKNPLANILIAQGFLVGSSNYQNDALNYMNRILLRHTVPPRVLP